MSFQLHKAPQFLLDLFRLRTTGGQPYNFGDTVLPTVDVTSMYGAPMQLTSSTAATIGAMGLSNTFNVANVARYHGVAAELTQGANAGTWCRIVISYRHSPSSVAFPLFMGNTFVPRASQAMTFGGLFPQPLVAPPGSVFLVYAIGDATGVDHALDLRLFSEDILRG